MLEYEIDPFSGQEVRVNAPEVVGKIFRAPKQGAIPDASKFKEEYINDVKGLAWMGATLDEVAEYFKIDIVTLFRWRKSFPEFEDAMNSAREAATDRVVHALFKKAIGFTVKVEKIYMPQGASAPVRVETTEYYPPSDAAAIFWLKNRRRSEWSDNIGIEHSGKVTLESLVESSFSADAKLILDARKTAATLAEAGDSGTLTIDGSAKDVTPAYGPEKDDSGQSADLP